MLAAYKEIDMKEEKGEQDMEETRKCYTMSYKEEIFKQF